MRNAWDFFVHIFSRAIWGYNVNGTTFTYVPFKLLFRAAGIHEAI